MKTFSKNAFLNSFWCIIGGSATLDKMASKDQDQTKYCQLENVAIAVHCNLRPPGLLPDPPGAT